MTIALRAAGTAIGGTTAVGSVNPSVPAGTVVGDISVLIVSVKPYSTTITDPSGGWVKISEHTNGTTGSSTDAGSTKVAMYVLEDAPVGAIGNIGFSGANTAGAVIHSFSKTKSTWDYSEFTQGFDSANGANYSATGDAGIDVAAGDMVVAGTAINGDVGTLSAWAIGGMSGATLGTSTNRTNSATTTGNDSRLTADEVAITAGSSSAAPTYAFTNASSTSGTTMWLRLRETNVSNVVRYKFETGADDDTITAGNTNSTTVILTGGTAVIDTGVSYSATRSVLGDATSTSGGVYWSLSVPQQDEFAADMYIYLNALPSAEQGVMSWLNGSTRMVSLNVTTTGQIRIRDGGGGGGANAWTSTATMSTGQWYRISMYATQHASTGTVRAAFFSTNSATPLDDSTLLTAKNTGASPYNTIRWGVKAGVGTTTMNANLDDYAYDLGGTDLIEPEITNTQVDPTAIATAEAFGTTVVDIPITASPSAIASAEAFGTVVANVVIDVAPSAIASAEAFGSPTVNFVTTVEPSGIASAEAHGTPAVDIPIQAQPSGIASAEAFGTVEITGAIILNPNGIPSGETWPSPVISQVLAVSPGGIASAEAFGSPVVSGILNVSPGGIASAENVPSVVVSLLLTVSPGGIASEEAFGTPSIGVGADVQPSGIASEEAFGSATVIDHIEVAATSVASTEAFGTPNINAQIPVSVSGIASAEAFGSPTLSTPLQVDLEGMPSHETVMAPVVVLTITVTPSTFEDSGGFGVPTISYGPITVMAPSIQTQEAFGVVTIGGGNILLQPDGIAAQSAVGTPTLTLYVPWPPIDSNPFSVIESKMHQFSVKEVRIDETLI